MVGAGRLVGGTLTARYLLCPGSVRSRADLGEFVAMWPRHDGDYRLPEPRL